MSEQFKKGQLVAVRDHPTMGWTLRIYSHVTPEGKHVCLLPDNSCAPGWWEQAVAAEEVWPEVFVSADRENVDSLQKERDRLHQAIGWLCDRLEWASREHDFCPPNALPDDCDNACWECWQQAVYEAMENKPCP